MNIADYIPYGRVNAVTRSFLVAKTGLTDRKVRELITEYRAKWTPEEPMICSDSECKGYWLSNDRNEIERCRDFLNSYRNSTGRVVGNIDKQLSLLDGTGRIWVRGHYRRIRAAAARG